MGAVLYWISNPLWVGGSLAFISTEAWSAYIHPVGSQTVGDYLFKMAFIWVTVFVAIIALRRGKWIPNLGAIVRIGVLGLFSLTVVIYAIEHGVHGYGVSDFRPEHRRLHRARAAAALQLRRDSSCKAVRPRRWSTRSVTCRWPSPAAGVIAILCYLIPIFGIVAVLPTNQVTGIAGFLDAVDTTFTVYGSAHHILIQADGVDVHLRPGDRRRRLDHRLRPGARGCRIRRRASPGISASFTTAWGRRCG